MDPSSPVPLHRQLYEQLRQAIFEGALPPARRLPSTRALAADLGVSRNTVLAAFQQLIAEGYLKAHTGRGTLVSESLPDRLLRVGGTHAEKGRRVDLAELSDRGNLIGSETRPDRHAGRPIPFRLGVPAINEFPARLWGRLLARRWRASWPDLLPQGEAAGYRPLREAVASYVQAARGVRCTSEQVIIVDGAQQGIDIAARLLLDPGDEVWLEEPGYRGARVALTAAGARVVPVPVDAEGIDVAAGRVLAPRARLACVTPSHQHPLGPTMTVPRRRALLSWASAADAWILEDDYDSEYRYMDRPIAALQGLDQEGRVVYVGTFSKTLFPALRLGFLVVPERHVDAFCRAVASMSRHAGVLQQAVLADFIVEGHFARHVARMRRLYAERQRMLVELIRTELGDLLRVAPAPAGMRLLGWLPDGLDDAAVSARATRRGVDVEPLSLHRVQPGGPGGLLLGFAPFTAREMIPALRELRGAIRDELVSQRHGRRAAPAA